MEKQVHYWINGDRSYRWMDATVMARFTAGCSSGDRCRPTNWFPWASEPLHTTNEEIPNAGAKRCPGGNRSDFWYSMSESKRRGDSGVGGIHGCRV